MYHDQSLVSQAKFAGTRITNDGDLHIGGYHQRSSLSPGGYDNIQIFDKPLTSEEITVLALANKDVLTD